MNNDFTTVATIAAITGSGLLAGLYFTFSTFVMKALSQIPVPSGIMAMQRINVTVVNPFVILVIFGTPLLSIYLAVAGANDLSGTVGKYLLAGALVHILGSSFVTGAFNVPRNNVLAAVDPESETGGRVWEKYLEQWTVWNHVRAIASLVSAVLLMLALAAN